MDVGLELQQARERQGVSLQQISRSTKISLRVLQAIETSDPAALPARVFTRSFVKTYAQEVGLHPEITMRRYLEQIEKFEPPAPDLTHDTLETPSAAVAREALVLPALFTARLVRGRFGTATVLVLAGLAAFVLAVKQGRRGESRETPKPLASPRVVSSAGISPAGTAPAPVGMSGATSTSAALSVSGTSGTSGTPGASRGSGTPATTPLPSAALHLAIAPTGPCWVQATVGDQHVLERLLNAGDRRVVDTPSDVTLRIGDPATFAFSINGKPARIPGASGKAVTVQLTKENYSRFLMH